MNISKNQFRNFIKEEIRKALREDYATKLYKIEGLLVTDTYKKTQTQILSDIRSITGITTIDSREYRVNLPKPGYQYDVLTVKVDPYPYTRNGGKFDINNINQIIDNIKKIRGVIRFKVDNPQLINIGI